jgi:alpha-tubulin suppressor-like RCC1 family protein
LLIHHTGHKIVQISSGENHDLALTDKGDVFEWGNTRISVRILSRLKQGRLSPARVLFPRTISL